jgi:hypothetical protein
VRATTPWPPKSIGSVRPRRIERRSAGYQPAALPLCYGRAVWVAGVEPAASSFQARASSADLHPGVPWGNRTPVVGLKARHPHRWTNGTERSRPESNRRCAGCGRVPSHLATRPLAPAAGIEPALFRLTAGRLSSWLRWNGSGARIRTSIHGFKDRGPPFGRHRNGRRFVCGCLGPGIEPGDPHLMKVTIRLRPGTGRGADGPHAALPLSYRGVFTYAYDRNQLRVAEELNPAARFWRPGWPRAATLGASLRGVEPRSPG